MSFHVSLQKNMKWSRKLFFHLLNMLILNSHLLNKKFGKKKIKKDDFIEHLANYLVNTGLQTLMVVQKKFFQNHQSQGSLKGTFLNTCQKEMARFKLYCAKLAILLPHNYLKWVITQEDCHIRQGFIGVKSANHHCA